MRKLVVALLGVAVPALITLTAGCDDKPVAVHIYEPYPEQLSDLSADSSFVYFRDEGTAFGRSTGIYRIPIDGMGEPEVVVEGELLYDPTVSPDGRELAFTVYSSAFVIRDLATGADSVFPLGWVAAIEWYNSDTLICDLVDAGIFLFDRETGLASRIVGELGRFPVVSRSGNVVYCKYLPDIFLSDTSVLCMTDLSGTEYSEVYRSIKEQVVLPRWSDDGQLLVFAKQRTETPRLSLLRLPEVTLVDSLAVFASRPTFLRDGRIAFVALGDKSRGETDNICIMNVDGSNRRYLLNVL